MALKKKGKRKRELFWATLTLYLANSAPGEIQKKISVYFTLYFNKRKVKKTHIFKLAAGFTFDIFFFVDFLPLVMMKRGISDYIR